MLAARPRGGRCGKCHSADVKPTADDAKADGLLDETRLFRYNRSTKSGILGHLRLTDGPQGRIWTFQVQVSSLCLFVEALCLRI